MTLTFVLGLLAFGTMQVRAATNLGHPALPYLAVLSFLVNIASAVVVRMARRVAPSRFPVVWRGGRGNVGGFGAHLLLAAMSTLVFSLATRMLD